MLTFDEWLAAQPVADSPARAATTRALRARAIAAGVLVHRPRRSMPDALQLKDFFERLADSGWSRKRIHNRTILTDHGWADSRLYLA